MQRDARNGLRYTAEILGAAALYAAVLFARRPLLHLTPDGAPHTLILLSPVVPILLMATAIVRHYFRQDEYGRLLFLQVVGICTGAAACLTASYPFIKDAFGLHQIPIAYAWPVLGACWFVGAMVMLLRQRAMARAAGA